MSIRSCAAPATSTISVLVLDREAQAETVLVSQAATLHSDGVRVRTLSLFYEDWLGMLPVAELERVSLLFDIGELHRARYGRLKRVVDVCLALLALPFLALAVPVVALGNLAGQPGVAALLADAGGQERRARSASSSSAPCVTPPSTHRRSGRPRTIPASRRFGRLLRMSHLDELPQVVNILKGDLSVVGPRPEQPRYVEELRQKLPFYDVRHLVRPGLTGWAQVKYGYAGDESDAMEKLQYEFYYLRHQSRSASTCASWAAPSAACSDATGDDAARVGGRPRRRPQESRPGRTRRPAARLGGDPHPGGGGRHRRVHRGPRRAGPPARRHRGDRGRRLLER